RPHKHVEQNRRGGAPQRALAFNDPPLVDVSATLDMRAAFGSAAEDAMTDQKSTLVNFLVRKAFDPVLHARPDGRSDADRKTLEHVQQATRAEIERYRGYGSAAEVVTNFKRDLHSSAAKKVHAELKRLGLPTINDIRDEFEAKVKELGIQE
ncbi:MAG TPA: hypothetical protein VE690_07635, partial [Rhodopila sp.]|nr:hypothetical protein [Rhodopila sp.]